MCNIRGFRHACNHTVFRYISACRATFGDPNSPSTPRCLPSTSYIMSMTDECLQCQYDTFCRTWEKRISEAEKRRDVFAAQLSPRKSRQEPLSSNSWSNWATEPDNSTAMDESYWGDAEDSSDGDDGLNAIERCMLIKERDAADQKATKLQNEYDTEKWELWQGFLSGSDMATIKKKANYWNQRRRTNPKINGGSSLRHVQNADDLPEPQTPPVDVYLFGSDELSGDETDESDCSSTPALSRSSTVSDDSNSSDDEIEGLSEETLIHDQKEFRLVLDVSEKKRNPCSTFNNTDSVQDEGDGEMLPMWLECF